MGRKIEIKKIEELTKRQVTFSKRRSSIMKKAEEIAVCCDVDVLFVAFSPSGRLSKFSNQKRIEDMLQRYVNLPVERRLTHIPDVQEKVGKLMQLSHIRGDLSKLHFLDKQIENLELQAKKSTLSLQILDATIRDYEPGEDQNPSLHHLYWCEKNLQHSLQKVMARKMELERQGNMDVHVVAQQTAPQQQIDINWVNPYSANIEGNILQDWNDKGKGIASDNSSNYAYNDPFASSSQFGNTSFSQIQNPSSYIVPIQSAQQNMVVNVQQIPAQTFGQPEVQVTLGESSGNSIMNFWQDICTSTRPISTPFSNTGTQFNNPSQIGIGYADSNWNVNHNNNNVNQIIQHNDVHSSVQNDTRAHPNNNLHGCNYTMEDNNMGNNNGYFVEGTQANNDPWEWNDDVLNGNFNVEDLKNLD